MLRLAAAAFGLALLAIAAPCLAEDDPIATAGRTPIPAPAPQPVETIAPPTQSPIEPQATPEPVRKTHGEVEVGVGTGGYRRAAGAATIPLGKTGEVTVAVEKTEGRVRYQ